MNHAAHAHPAFTEAVRLRDGIGKMPGANERAAAMIDLVGDDTGRIASGIIALYDREPNGMEAICVAFLAGLLIGRDG